MIECQQGVENIFKVLKTFNDEIQQNSNNISIIVQ